MNSQSTLKNSILLLFTFFSSFGFAQTVDSYTLYVSPTGNDAAKGTSRQEAFATIQQAQKHIREQKKNGKLTKPIVVYLKGGEYSISNPLVFTEEDSGTEQAPITYRSIDNENVLISGGRNTKTTSG